MKSAIEIYVNAIVIIMIVSTSVFFICTSLRSAQARNFHSTTVAKIEASEGSSKVVEACVKEATEKGYELKVEPTCLYKNRKYYYVQLTYTYEIPFIHGSRTNHIEGFAR